MGASKEVDIRIESVRLACTFETNYSEDLAEMLELTELLEGAKTLPTSLSGVSFVRRHVAIADVQAMDEVYFRLDGEDLFLLW